ncbi:hypothetical protein HaLaN_07531, partial [Haematococcus lacustris]
MRALAELSPPTLVHTPREEILQFSDLFGMREDEVAKYMSQPIVADESAKDAEMLSSLHARQEQRRARLGLEQGSRRAAGASGVTRGRAGTTARHSSEEDSEDETTLLQRLPSDPQLLAA